MKIVWDPDKAWANQQKHDLSFDEAQDLLTSGVDYLEIFDQAHSDDEDRFIAIGPIQSRLILVVWTEQDEHTIRLISARWATRREGQLFHQAMEQRR